MQVTLGVGFLFGAAALALLWFRRVGVLAGLTIFLAGVLLASGTVGLLAKRGVATGVEVVESGIDGAGNGGSAGQGGGTQKRPAPRRTSTTDDDRP